MPINLVEPEISDRFDLDDIRKIRDYNAVRHMNMTPQEIVDEINSSADEVIRQYGLKEPIRLNHF